MKRFFDFLLFPLVLASLFTPYAAVFAQTQSQLAPVCSIVANPGSVQLGETTNLTWRTTNATGGTIDTIGSVDPNGTQGVIPRPPLGGTHVTYNATFTGPGGSVTCSVTVFIIYNSGGFIGGTVTPNGGTITPNGGTISPNGTVTTGNAGTSGGTSVNGTSPFGTSGDNGNGSSGSGSFNGSSGNFSSNGSSDLGIVPCDGIHCQACNIAQGIQNVIKFAIGLAIPIAVALFAYAGFKYATAGGDTHSIEEAHHVFSTAGFGFLITLSAWLIINTLLVVLIQGGQYKSGSWFTISCVSENTPAGRQIDNGGNALLSVISTGAALPMPGGTEMTLQTLQGATSNSSKYSANFQSACSQNGLSGSDCTALQAICAVESQCGANVGPNGCNSVGSCGPMQITPTTACKTDPSFTGCNSNGTVGNLDQVEQALQGTASFSLGAKIFAKGLNSPTCSGDIACAEAAYNGGAGMQANGNGSLPPLAPSQCCPGEQAYQCQYDCKAPVGTTIDCTATPTPAGCTKTTFETYYYVKNVQKAQQLLSPSTPE